MPPVEDIQRQMLGSWRMMTGRRDGIRLLDLSVDGFWNSFFAIVLALPILVLSWVPIANEACGPDSTLGIRAFYMVRLGLADIGSWVLPLAGLAAAAPYAGIRDRFAHYVVATNWGSALFAWFMLPASLLRLFAPGAAEFATLLALGIFLGSLVLSWRLTDASIERGPLMTTGVFAGMLVASIVTLFALQDILGLSPV